jgi:hypothetical protein
MVGDADHQSLPVARAREDENLHWQPSADANPDKARSSGGTAEEHLTDVE